MVLRLKYMYEGLSTMPVVLAVAIIIDLLVYLAKLVLLSGKGVEMNEKFPDPHKASNLGQSNCSTILVQS